MAEITYKITKEIGVLSESSSGWTRQINMVSWNDRDPKYDIRDWAPEREKMSKGISLTAEEVALLKDILNKLEL